MATSLGRVYLNGCNYELAYDLLGQNSASNQSNVRLYGILHVTNNYISWSRGSASVHTSGLQGIGTYYSKGDHVLITRDFTFTHDSNGNFSMYIGASLSTSFVSGDTGGTLTLPKINRIATINSFTGTDVEGIFKSTYTTYVSNYNYKLRISIPNVKALMTVDNYLSGSEISLDEESIKYISDYMNNKNTSTVSLGAVIETWSGTSKVGESSEIVKVFSFTDAEPTFTYTFKETNRKIIDVLGTSGDILVQNASQPKIIVTPTALKGATISSVDFTHNGVITRDTTSPYEYITTAVNNTFDILVTDSRKLTASETLTKNLIPYQPVKINSYEFKRENPTSSNIYLNLDSLYYQTKFNETDNVPLVEWKLNEGTSNLYPSNNLYPSEDLYSENSWVTIPSEYYEIDKENNKLTIRNYLLEDILSYTEKGQFYIRISDLFTETTDNMVVIRGIPVMDWGEHDVQINGDLYLADENRENPINVKEVLDILKPVVLFNNPSGESGTIELNDEAENYEYLEIFYSLNGRNKQKSARYYIDFGDTIVLDGQWCTDDGTIIQFQTSEFIVTGKKIEKVYERYVNSNHIMEPYSQNSLYIKRVLGYKKTID